MTTLSIPTQELTYEPLAECGPTESVKPQGAAAKGWRICCPVCASLMVASKVVTDEPVYDLDLGGHKVRRRAYCGPCDKVIGWMETATASGKPLHEVISGPGLAGGKTYTANFLRDHPETIWEDIT